MMILLMRLYKWLTLILALFLLACHDAAPIIDSNGQPVNLSQHPNRWLIINYWATWCGPCRKEISELNAFYAKHSADVLLYGVDYDHLPLEKLRQAGHSVGIQYPMLLTDPAETLKLDSLSTVPMTFVFDPDGHLHTVLAGPQTVTSLEAAIHDDI